MFQKTLFTYQPSFNLRNSLSFFIGILFFALMIGCEEKAEKPDDSMDFSQKLTCEAGSSGAVSPVDSKRGGAVARNYRAALYRRDHRSNSRDYSH